MFPQTYVKRWKLKKTQISINVVQQNSNLADLFKVAVSRDFLALFVSLTQPIWAPDTQVKIVSLKNSFSRIFEFLVRKIRLPAG